MTWVLVEARTNCCHDCRKMVQNAWCYYEGKTCTLVLCIPCAEARLEGV